MKIGLVLSQTPTYSETFFNSKIKGLQQSGFEVTLFVQKKSKDFDLCKIIVAPKVFKRNVLFQLFNSFFVGIHLLKYQKRLWKFIQLEKRAGRSVKQIIKNIYSNSHLLKANLDWLHFGFATIALQSEHVAKSIGANMAVSLRGFDIAIYPLKHPRCYDLLWRHVDKVHTISEDLQSIAYTLGMKPNTPYAKITPAIDIKKFKVELVHNKNSITDKVNFLTVGRLHWKKGLMDTLEALVILKNKGVSFSYIIVGEGSEFEALSFAIHQMQLSEQVTLIGKGDHEKIAELMNQCDIYLQYSISEGFCNAVLEAQAMGCLCVVSDAEGLPENVIDKTTGWIVPKRNPQELAKTILEVISLPEVLRLKISINAQQRVALEFNIEKQQKEFVEFYS